ncbi:double-strand break repair protein AddB [Microvirga sp. W0021]|uniref:Double-strand break repair protein AddB n=1 Tax=Hohaiivirga grylli TaxID=3133970 RepID=A0ABV0BGI3_9HYPH
MQTRAPSQPKVFSIPPGTDFLSCLTDALLSGQLIPGFPAEHADLADLTIYLPTRRAARALIMLLAERMGGKTLLLPNIVPLGEVDTLGLDLSGMDAFAENLLAPPIGTVERRMIFAQLVQQWSKAIDKSLVGLSDSLPFIVPSSPADAVGLAGDLEALMDQFTTEDAPWDQIAAAVDADYSNYFKLTLEFVKIATESWPQILGERNASDPVQRRKFLIEAEAQRLDSEQPDKPVIVAGSTGSVPATARLISAISRLPKGAIVLPGLDTELDDASWELIGSVGDDETDAVHGHPQTTLHRLLKQFIRLPRSEVRPLGQPSPSLAQRNRFFSETLRPAESTDLWAAIKADERLELAAIGTESLTLIEASDEREEALACAVALRETLETPGHTAALVTPDRGLASRVKAELLRWGIEVEDSAGTALSHALAGKLARLAAETAADDFSPASLLALLAHPFVTFGISRQSVEEATSALEIGILRGPAPGPGLNGLRSALAIAREQDAYRKPAPWKRIGDDGWQLAENLVTQLEQAFTGFSPSDFPEETNLATISIAHRKVVEALYPDDEIFDGSQGELEALFNELEQVDPSIGVTGRFIDYPAFFHALASERSVAPPGHLSHRRLKILGLLEARLLSADRIVLGGLDEGIWPPSIRTDAFLNRPMKAKLGLIPPERRIGQTAHDFVQLASANNVVITRATKRDGSPMVPSRFLQRMKAFSGDEVWNSVTRRGDYYRKLAALVEYMEPSAPLKRPTPQPDPRYFPRSLSVTEIETLQRDPYAIYAKHILKLDALDPLSQAPGAADRGTIIHDVVAQFASQWPNDLPEDALAELLQMGAEAFKDIHTAFPQVYAEWWPRFERLAHEFIAWEQARRGDIHKLLVEESGRLSIPLEDGSVFLLRARADRIESHRDGSATVIDFKTGRPPGVKEIFAGFAPQMTLEATMLLEGAFKDIPVPSEAPDLLYIHASGGKPALDQRPVKPERGEERTVADIIAEHRRKLEVKLNNFVMGRVPYTSRPFPKFAKRYSDYDHLARVKEWSLTSGEDGGEAE